MAHNPKLTREESSALRMLANAALMKKAIPEKTLERLIALKFVEQKTGGIVVTAIGSEFLLKSFQ